MYMFIEFIISDNTYWFVFISPLARFIIHM